MKTIADYANANIDISEEEKNRILNKFKNQQVDEQKAKDNLQKKFAFNALEESMFGTDDTHMNSLDNVTSPYHNDQNHIYEQIINGLINVEHELAANDNKQNIFLYGNPGTGKSYLARAMMNSMFYDHKVSMFVNTNDLKNLIYESFRDIQAKQKLNRKIKFMKKVDFLVLDDFGTESSNKTNTISEANESIQQIFYTISNARINKSTLLTSNFDRDYLKDIYNEKIISRLIPERSTVPVSFEHFNDLR